MKYQQSEITSSYSVNDLGKTLYDYVLENTPKKIIDFGIFRGYSSIAMAMALDEIGEGEIHCYDVNANYLKIVEENFKKFGLLKYAKFSVMDFDKYKPEKFDLFHLDINNTGKIINNAYHKLINYGGDVIFEGGSEERDSVMWMIEQDQLPINKSQVYYVMLNEKFPSLSLMFKK